MANPKLCLNWNDFQDDLKSAFQDLRWDTDFADVTLACEDQSIKAHQVVLSASSPFFQKLLKTHSHPHPLIYMKGVKLDNILALMDYIYLGSVDIYQDHIEEFLLLAEELQLKGMSEKQFGEINSGSFSTDVPFEQDESTSNEEEPEQKVSIIRSDYETVIKYGNPLTACNNETYFNLNELAKNDIKKTVKKEKQVKKIKLEKQTKRNAGKITANVGQASLKQSNDEQKQGKNISTDILEQIDLMIEKQQKDFSCKVCGYITRNKGHANEHVEKHIEGLEYPCNICRKILRYFFTHPKYFNFVSAPQTSKFLFQKQLCSPLS